MAAKKKAKAPAKKTQKPARKSAPKKKSAMKPKAAAKKAPKKRPAPKKSTAKKALPKKAAAKKTASKPAKPKNRAALDVTDVSPLATVSVAAFRRALASRVARASTTKPSISAEEVHLLFRPFLWFAHGDTMFRDVYEASVAAIPVLGAYLIALATDAREDERDAVERVARLLAVYLDNGSLEVIETEEATSLVAQNLAGVPERIEALGGSVLALAPPAQKKQRELDAQRGKSPTFDAILALSEADRVRNLVARFEDISAARRGVFDLLRVLGLKLLPALEVFVDELAPTDQDLIFNALDGFQGEKRVLALYARHYADTPYETLKPKLAAYAARVRGA